MLTPKRCAKVRNCEPVANFYSAVPASKTTQNLIRKIVVELLGSMSIDPNNSTTIFQKTQTHSFHTSLSPLRSPSNTPNTPSPTYKLNQALLINSKPPLTHQLTPAPTHALTLPLPKNHKSSTFVLFDLYSFFVSHIDVTALIDLRNYSIYLLCIKKQLFISFTTSTV